MLNNRYKKLLNQSALYGLSIFLMKGIALIMLPVYTNFLAPAEYGRLEVLVVFSNLISIFLGFGLVEALYRFVGLADSIEQKQRHATECLLVAAIIAIFSYTTFHFFSISMKQQSFLFQCQIYFSLTGTKFHFLLYDAKFHFLSSTETVKN